jgi:YCII-related domain
MGFLWFVSLYRDAARAGRRDKEPSVDAIPDLVRCPRDEPHPRRGNTRRGQGRALNAGVWVFGGGLENQKASVVATDGTVADGPYPEAIGGLCVVDVRSREEALEWAAKNAIACRCAQEVREFMPDPTVGN